MLHLLHDRDFELAVVDIFLSSEQHVLLKHFDSIVFIRLGIFCQENCSECSFRQVSQKFQITDVECELSELRCIRLLTYNKHMEWSIFRNTCCFICWNVICSKQLIIHDIEIWDSHQHLLVTRIYRELII
jgi:hypothetical protein